MREIKFRAWDPVFKVWLAKDFHLFGEVTCFQIVEQELKPDGSGRGSLERMGDVQVSQFTGLRDKIGKDIYEGDVVSWQGDTFEVVYGVRDCAYQLAKIFPRDYEIGLGIPQTHWAIPLDGAGLKVIGNIHQHPHLVK